MSADARALREVVDDLIDRLEKTGVDDTTLGPAYMRISLRDARGRADDLIGTLDERASGAESEARDALSEAHEARAEEREARTAFEREIDRLNKELTELRATAAQPVPA